MNAIHQQIQQGVLEAEFEKVAQKAIVGTDPELWVLCTPYYSSGMQISRSFFTDDEKAAERLAQMMANHHEVRFELWHVKLGIFKGVFDPQ